ncbi:MAG: ammonium transporter, partial [Clostridia bacterium]|nr:ammonium transporter [Clostridia bacterium]
MTFSAVNTIWVLLGAALVFFMQAGFAMCEAGFTRAKNTGNILMKNLMDFCIGTPLYWLFGFGIMFGAGTAAFGWIDPFIMRDYAHILPAGVPLWAYAIFQTVFCATSATIVSGAMAERTKFSAYCVYSAAISLFIYPMSGHWIWGGGWLAEMGFHDFAGSTAVHMVGGVCALIGAKMLGPRLGKYGKDGKPRAILGHNLSIAALGVVILWFCWFGFHGASTVGMDSDALIASAGLVFFNTNLAAAVATLAAMIFTWLRYGKPDVSMTFNAALAGLVGITAGCDAVNPFGAAIIGICCGFAVVLSVEFFDKVAKIDDPVGAISVHGVCGCLGTILTGFFATGVSTMKGVFYGGGFKFLGVQILGVASTIAWTAVVITIVFALIKKTIGLRADAADETLGLDRSEHGLTTAYSAQSNGASVTLFSASSGPISRGGSNFAKYSKVCAERDIKPFDVSKYFYNEMRAASFQVDQKKWNRGYNNSEEAMNWLIDLVAEDGLKVILERDNTFDGGPYYAHALNTEGNDAMVSTGQQGAVESMERHGKAAG